MSPASPSAPTWSESQLSGRQQHLGRSLLYRTIHVYDAKSESGEWIRRWQWWWCQWFVRWILPPFLRQRNILSIPTLGEGNGTAFQAQDGAFDSEVESILPRRLKCYRTNRWSPPRPGVRYQDNNSTWGEKVLYLRPFAC